MKGRAHARVNTTFSGVATYCVKRGHVGPVTLQPMPCSLRAGEERLQACSLIYSAPDHSSVNSSVARKATKFLAHWTPLYVSSRPIGFPIFHACGFPFIIFYPGQAVKTVFPLLYPYELLTQHLFLAFPLSSIGPTSLSVTQVWRATEQRDGHRTQEWTAG